MRIGTWNLEGRWDDRTRRFLDGLACDVLLLTEVRREVVLARMSGHHSAAEMTPGRSWAAVYAGARFVALPDPHGASAMVAIDGLRYCSSILPWRNCGSSAPWSGADQGTRTSAAVSDIVRHRPTIWGGDWNHALDGRDWAGSRDGRAAIESALVELDLQVPTRACPHPRGQRSIDHVAVPAAWEVGAVEHHVAAHEGHRLSDHDAYVVEVIQAPPQV